MTDISNVVALGALDALLRIERQITALEDVVEDASFDSFEEPEAPLTGFDGPAFAPESLSALLVSTQDVGAAVDGVFVDTIVAAPVFQGTGPFSGFTPPNVITSSTDAGIGLNIATLQLAVTGADLPDPSPSADLDSGLKTLARNLQLELGVPEALVLGEGFAQDIFQLQLSGALAQSRQSPLGFVDLASEPGLGITEQAPPATPPPSTLPPASGLVVTAPDPSSFDVPLGPIGGAPLVQPPLDATPLGGSPLLGGFAPLLTVSLDVPGLTVPG